MFNVDDLKRMDRRAAIKWMLAGAAGVAALESRGVSATPPPVGYGTDPNLVDSYQPGDLWPLTFTSQQHCTATALCDLILPADEKSPSAGQLLVQEFIDEWISAPYPKMQRDRQTILEGLDWLNTECQKRFQRSFVDLTDSRKFAICDDICFQPKPTKAFVRAAKFF